jgi:glutamate-1-semialdehyde 2,1-aminomutase
MSAAADMVTKSREYLIAHTPRSRAAAQSAAETLPVEIAGTVEMPYTVYIESAQGARVTDIDGNSYIDLTMGFGPHILGHSPAVVRDALARQLGRCWHTGIHNAMQERLARLIVEASPCADSVMFCNSGTEATMYAIRAARGFTGKPRIAVFEGCYHGAHDYAVVGGDRRSPRSEPGAWVRGKGIPPGVADTVMVLPYRDQHAYELIERHRDELALVMIEPVQSSNPRLDNREFLAGLAEACRKNGVLLMFDEVISGFRIAYGGCQELYGLAPDLATYGKIVGGGIPVGAVAGRRDVMKMFTMQGSSNCVFSGGTFSGNPLTMAGGIAAVEYLRDHQQEVYPYLKAQSDRLAAAINLYCRDRGWPVQMLNAASQFFVVFTPGRIESSRDITAEFGAAAHAWDLHLLRHGVIVPGIHQAFISTAHTPADVDQVIAAIKRALDDTAADNLFAPRTTRDG